ncbi:MAG TPA: hypothetical protein VNF47_04540 [Streptosporangiaceae bacterium]|nr:hypothetical protein [Streptosporangiaceae bacterium]
MTAPGRAAEALRVLGLLAQHAPEPARGQFLAALRGRGLAEPYDQAAPATAVAAWRRPDWYVSAFVAEVLPALGPAEWTAATAAINTLGAPARTQPAPAGAETEASSND